MHYFPIAGYQNPAALNPSNLSHNVGIHRGISEMPADGQYLAFMMEFVRDDNMNKQVPDAAASAERTVFGCQMVGENRVAVIQQHFP
jgi:hypothetical protein